MPRKLRVRPYDPYQRLLVPKDITHHLADDHLSRFIADVTTQLDLSSMESRYDYDRGEEGYHPRMMLNLILYAYCTGTYSSRQISSHTYTDLAYRFLAAGMHPDHSTICRFLVTFQDELHDLFVQFGKLCRKVGLVKVGSFALDGTKIRANASKRQTKGYTAIVREHDALSEHVKHLLAEGASVDQQEDVRYGKDKTGNELPENVRNMQKRLETLRHVKEEMEEEARLVAEEHNRKIQERTEEEERTGKKKRGRKPQPKSEEPTEKQRHNFTDPDSRLMKDNATKAIIQGYNCQNIVDTESQFVLVCSVTHHENDKREALPMVRLLIETYGISDPQELKQCMLALDAGYFTEEDLLEIIKMGIDLYVSPDGYNAHPTIPQMKGRIPKGMSLKDRMRRKIRTKTGKEEYGKRKIVEAPFGWIKAARKFREFTLRGLPKVDTQWTLVNMTHNILVAHRSGISLRG